MLLTISSRRLHYDLLGAAGGETVCLLHSLASDGGMWAEQVAPLLAAGYRVLRVDLRGHGGSEPGAGDATIRELADDVLAVLDHLGLARLHLVGLSIGGIVAQALAVRCGETPRVEGVQRGQTPRDGGHEVSRASDARGPTPSGTDASGPTPSGPDARGPTPSGPDASGPTPSGTDARGLTPSSLPPTLLSLMLCDTAGATPPAWREVWPQRMTIVREAGSVAPLADSTIARWFTDDFRAREPRRWGEVRTTIAAMSPAGYLGAAAALIDFDFTSELPSLRVPTLVVCGEHDDGTPPAVNRTIAELIPGARYQEIAGARHMPNVEHAEAFNRLLLGWLRGNA